MNGVADGDQLRKSCNLVVVSSALFDPVIELNCAYRRSSYGSDIRFPSIALSELDVQPNEVRKKRPQENQHRHCG